MRALLTLIIITLSSSFSINASTTPTINTPIIETIEDQQTLRFIVYYNTSMTPLQIAFFRAQITLQYPNTTIIQTEDPYVDFWFIRIDGRPSNTEINEVEDNLEQLPEIDSVESDG